MEHQNKCVAQSTVNKHRGKGLQAEQIHLTWRTSWSYGEVSQLRVGSSMCPGSVHRCDGLPPLIQSSSLNEVAVHLETLWIVSRALHADVTSLCVMWSPPCQQIRFHHYACWNLEGKWGGGVQCRDTGSLRAIPHAFYSRHCDLSQLVPTPVTMVLFKCHSKRDREPARTSSFVVSGMSFNSTILWYNLDKRPVSLLKVWSNDEKGKKKKNYSPVPPGLEFNYFWVCQRSTESIPWSSMKKKQIEIINTATVTFKFCLASQIHMCTKYENTEQKKKTTIMPVHLLFSLKVPCYLLFLLWFLNI